MKCRACDSKNLFVGIDLGSLPIAGELSNNLNTESFETKMLICKECSLGQVSLDIDRSRLFSYYRFRTSYSQSFMEHSEKFVYTCLEKMSFSPKKDWVLELASNDGYLLKMFQHHDIDVLGVDPATNISMYAICDGVPTINQFFGSELAKEILRIKGYPKLIVANNVLAHVPDIQDFMKGISILCGDNTMVSIENPSIMNILNEDQFDTIYHEHYSYLSAYSVSKLANKFGLKLFDLNKYPVHGGSNRYWLSKNRSQLPSVFENIEDELNYGLLNENKWLELSNRINNKIIKFKSKIKDIKLNGGAVYGYAASGKASIVINFAGLNQDDINCIADDSFEKQGNLVPLANIPVTSLENMLKCNPTDIVIFSWNIYEELKQKIIKAGHSNINVWCWTD
jgi:hypothetical protein